MSYTKYQTEGIVLGVYNFSEADRHFYIFTKSFGLINARAQGIRELKSKLRYSLQNFSHSRLSLIRGRNVWRVAGAEEIRSIAKVFKENDLKIKTSAQVLSFLRRMLQGEERNESLFGIIKNGLSYLERDDLESEDIKDLEILIVLRILGNLGYLKSVGALSEFVETPYDRETLSKLKGFKAEALKEINKSIEASQL